jgi:hypothetical protein
MADDDARDERLGAWLEVEPLDEVTRRRLVSTALASTSTSSTAVASSRPSHAARWIAVAASIVVVLVAAVALLTAPGGNDEQQASTPARTPELEQKSTGAAAPQAAAPISGYTASVDVGDFGDLDVPANLARLRTALEAATATSGSATTPSSSADRFAPLDAFPCRDQLPSGTTTASATGTLDGRRAVVVLTTLPDGNRSIDAVLASPCEVRPLS